MIRDSRDTIEDRDAVARLCLEQWCRTPWRVEDMSPDIHGWRLCERSGRITGAMSYLYRAHCVYAMSFWVTDGLAGRRAAVELGLDMVKLATQLHRRLLFGVQVSNVTLQKAVESYGCSLVADHDFGNDTLLYEKECRGFWS